MEAFNIGDVIVPQEERMKRFEPGQLIVASRLPRNLAAPLLVLSASLNGDKETWTVEYLRGKKVVTSRMHPGSWKLLLQGR